MATFTSVQDGNWNDGGTWGNASPGVKGTDWPGLAGDVVNINHVVTYNVEETNQLGAITVNETGELIFSRTMNTLLSIGEVGVRVIGKLTVGTKENPIPKEYTAKILHYGTYSGHNLYSDSKTASTFSICGDPNYFGSIVKADLVSNWTTGQTFTIEGDLTTKWQSGQILVLIKDGEYDSTSTDTVLVTINSLVLNGSNTDITINEAFPGGTYSIGANIFNLSRNVIFSFNGNENIQGGMDYDTSSGGFNIYNNINSVISSARFGWGYGGSIKVNEMEYAVIHNVYNGRSIYDAKIKDVIYYSMYNGTSRICNCNGTGFYHISSRAHIEIMDSFFDVFVHCCLYQSNLILRSGSITNIEVYKTYTGDNFWFTTYFDNYSVGGYFGQNSNGLSYWVDEVFFYPWASSEYHLMKIKDFITPADYIPVKNTYINTDMYGPWWIFVEAFNGDRNDPRMVGSHGYGSTIIADGTGVEPFQRSGGNSRVWKIVNRSNCNRQYYTVVPIKVKYLVTSIPTTKKTFRVYVQTDYVGGINYKLVLWHNGGCTYSEGTISTRTDQSTWDYIEISDTISSDGYVELKMQVWGYEADKFIWVDPLIELSI